MKTILIAAFAAYTAAVPSMAQADLNQCDFWTAKISTTGKIVAQATRGWTFSSEDPAITPVEGAAALGGKALSNGGARLKATSVGSIYEKPGPLLIKFMMSAGQPFKRLLAALTITDPAE